MSSEPPEEPHLRSEPSILSPASPKPIHFPTPTNIPVLEMQMDVGFNQTEAHMSDPAMHNTEVRADFWRDPNELAVPADQASPYSTGGEAAQTVVTEVPAVESADASAEAAVVEDLTVDNDTTTSDLNHSDHVPISSYHESGVLQPEAMPTEHIGPSSDPSVPTADANALNQQSLQAQIDPASESIDAPQEPAEQATNSTVDVQSLLDTLQPAPVAINDAAFDASIESQPYDIAATNDPSPALYLPNQDPQLYASAFPAGVEGVASPSSASGLGMLPSGLPPRPPPQEQPLIHPNYVHSQHIRDYHPHAANPAFQPHVRTGSQGNVADPITKNYVPPVNSPSNANAPQTAGYLANIAIPSNPYATNGQPTPETTGTAVYTPSSAHTAGFTASPQNFYGAQYGAQTSTPMQNRLASDQQDYAQLRPEDRPWDAEVQRKYDNFIEVERKYVSEGRWEQFPQGSRLFVGNLSSEKVTKRDIFHVFHTYGELAQISIKQAYGFVQFLRTEDCNRALQKEQGTQIRDKKIHLEVSKPQKNRTQNVQRRSRSPPENSRGRPGSNVDRYVSGARGQNNNRGGHAGYRSPSPRGYRDRFDDRNRRRSRSPDYNRGGRYRSPSPRREAEDDLPLPRRAPRDVPDVQIIVLESLDRDFISWIERAFSSRSVRVDVLLLSPRLPEQAVVRRQIVEGVVAVVKLRRQNQNTAKIGLQIFDRSQGANNVKFEEYEGLDPSTAVELILRAKQSSAQAPRAGYGAYGAPQYGATSVPPQMQYGDYGGQPPTPSSYSQPPSSAYPPQAHGAPQSVPPHLQSLITNLDPNSLQNLLSTIGTPQSTTSNNPYGTPFQPNSAAVAALQNNPALAGYLQQQQQQSQAQGGGGAVNMQDILARLGTHQR